jgi:putative flippase GtrA
VKALMRSRFLRFAIVGAAGFFVNAAALYVALNIFHASRHAAWFIAFIPAVTFTWWGNRNLTFHEHKSRTMMATFHEWLRFVVTNGFGALVNYLTYEVLMGWAPFPLNNPYVALAAGVLAGMMFNFTLSKKLVFKA